MNKKHIQVNGCIVDSIHNSPIPKTKVTILCWYHAGWDKTDYVSIDTITDKNGCFDVAFEEGYKVVVASVSQEHIAGLVECKEITEEKVSVILKLKARTSHSELFDYHKFDLRDFIVQNTTN